MELNRSKMKSKKIIKNITLLNKMTKKTKNNNKLIPLPTLNA